MRSSSTNTGISTITVTFEIGRDPDLAAVDVQNRVNQALGRMPAEVRTNGISVTKNTRRVHRRDRLLHRRQPLRLAVHQQLSRSVRPRRVQARAGRRQRHHLRRAQVRDAAVAGSDELAGRGITAGRRRQRAARAERAGGGRQHRRRAVGRRSDVPDQRARGRAAHVDRRVRERRRQGRAGRRAGPREGRRPRRAGRRERTRRSCGSPASRRPASASSCCRRPTRFRCSTASRRSWSGCEQNFPPGLKAQIAFDNVTVVRESIWEVLMTLAEAIGLVVLVMFLFLQNWRSTIIPAITIPGVARRHVRVRQAVRLLDQHADALRHRARHRHRRRRRDRRDREHRTPHARVGKKRAHGRRSTRWAKCSRPSSSSASCSVAVFVPVAFFPGTTGRMYQQFSLTIAFSVVLSVFNAVTFTPALSALLLDRETHAHGLVLHGRQPGHRRRHAASTCARCGWRCAGGCVMMLVFVGGLCGDLGRLLAPCRRRSCRTRTRATSSRSSRRRPARRWSTRRTSRGRPSRSS